jgi:hypothetical protein
VLGGAGFLFCGDLEIEFKKKSLNDDWKALFLTEALPNLSGKS